MKSFDTTLDLQKTNAGFATRAKSRGIFPVNLWTMLLRRWTAFRLYLSQRMALQTLSEMDAHQLDDIGLSPSDVKMAMRRPMPGDPFDTLRSARTIRSRGRRHA